MGDPPASVTSPRFSPLFEHSPVAMFLLDPSGLVLTTNLAGARILGRESIPDLLGHRFDVQDFITDPGIREPLFEELHRDGHVTGREVPLTRSEEHTPELRSLMSITYA